MVSRTSSHSSMLELQSLCRSRSADSISEASYHSASSDIFTNSDSDSDSDHDSDAITRIYTKSSSDSASEIRILAPNQSQLREEVIRSRILIDDLTEQVARNKATRAKDERTIARQQHDIATLSKSFTELSRRVDNQSQESYYLRAAAHAYGQTIRPVQTEIERLGTECRRLGDVSIVHTNLLSENQEFKTAVKANFETLATVLRASTPQAR